MASTKFTTIARSFSAAAQGMIKPPIQVFGIEGRYATALFSAGSKQNQLEAIEKDLVKFQTALKSDGILKEFVENPINKRSLKANTLQLAAKKLALSAPTSNFLGLLAENGRIKNLNSIINSFKIIMAAHRGDLSCVVTTAKPLDSADLQELKKTLQAFAKKGETIKIELKVDPTIIGGIVVSIGDKYVDMSVATKIKKYTEIIQDAV
ncbi:ATPase, OSCP/delta subunit,F1F0 ATP synthase OSCP/delta subunit, N-terminal domain [Cinara cedri]|uniref:Oligomycin sensitivity conferral protein n=1 Tax=Cinara cedri TaxID=506608 RepID=A0A5E4LZ52_9HEMI|nr:ATPase, OSCP/delta subunit,F1F0 ATP synthase OSCP/delta subunit, N-terminal domain [Cinara cedri]